MTNVQHSTLASGRWNHLSLAEQLGNIGSEISRATRWHNRDEKTFFGAVYRALELFDLTISDVRWRHRLKEICRAREIFCDIVYGSSRYNTTLADLDRYFTRFALLRRR